MTVSVPSRSEIAREFTWNAESVFADATAWEAELNALLAELTRVQAYRGRLGEGPAVLADALEAVYAQRRRVDILGAWAAIDYFTDTTHAAAAERYGRAENLNGQARAAAAFLQPELLAVGEAVLRAWLAAEPRLAPYAHFIDDLFRRQAHVRSPEVEELLGLLADPFGGPRLTASMLTDADMRFTPGVSAAGGPVEVNQGSIDAILAAPDREARRTGWEHYMDGYLAHRNTLAANLATSIKQDVFRMRARRHASTLEAALFENHIPPAVFHNLIETFRRNLPVWHRYWRVRRRALGVETLHPYDIWAPLTANPPRVPYPQAVDWICAGLAPLGDEYVSVMRRGCLEDRWVDIYPNRGKFSGAFSWGAQGTHPFIVMSYTDDLFGLSTLAHELGHSMHSYLAWQTQPKVYGSYSLFAAEVASNFHQAMTRAYLLAQFTDRDLRINVIEEAMSNFHRYFFIMPTLARFELEMHERAERGQGLTAALMIDRMADLFAEAYGDEMHIDRERVGATWATFSHLYEGYYVFQYATGISAANAFSQRILSGTPGAAEAYLGFLKAGSSRYPLDAIRAAGVDLASPATVDTAFGVLAGLVEQLETLTA